MQVAQVWCVVCVSNVFDIILLVKTAFVRLMLTVRREIKVEAVRRRCLQMRSC